MSGEEPESQSTNSKPCPASNETEQPTAGDGAKGVKTVNQHEPSESKPADNNDPNRNFTDSFKAWLRDPHRDKPKWTDVAIVILTGGIIFLGAMQWIEMHSGGKDTHDLAVQAKSQADAAKSQADGTKNLADRMKDEADRTKVIAEQAVVQANAAQSQARASIDQVAKLQAGVDETHALASAARDSLAATQENFVKEQAPIIWVAPQDVKMEQGKRLFWDIQFSTSVVLPPFGCVPVFTLNSEWCGVLPCRECSLHLLVVAIRRVFRLSFRLAISNSLHWSLQANCRPRTFWRLLQSSALL